MPQIWLKPVMPAQWSRSHAASRGQPLAAGPQKISRLVMKVADSWVNEGLTLLAEFQGAGSGPRRGFPMRYVMMAFTCVSLVLAAVSSAQAEKRMFIIANDADGYGVDRCLA